MMFYQRDIITKKKNFLPTSNPLPVEKEETPFHGRIIANGDDMLRVADKAPKQHTYSKRVIVNGPDVITSKPQTEAPAPKPKSRRVIV